MDSDETTNQNIELWAARMEANHLPTSGRLLELGCGAGSLTMWFEQRAFEVYGVDIAPSAIEWARETAAAQGSHAVVDQSDICQGLNYPDAWCDIVVDGHCYHCIIGEDRRKFLAQAFRVLKPNGWLLILTMVNNPAACEDFTGYDAVRRVQFFDDKAVRYFVEPTELCSELEAAGFEIYSSKVIPRNDEKGTDRMMIDARKKGILA